MLICPGCRQLVTKSSTVKLPQAVRPYISSISWEPLGNIKPDVSLQRYDEGIFHLHLTYSLEESIQQDDWRLNVTPAFSPGFFWAPHLTPSENTIIDQHVFRSPALIVSSENKVLTIVPDLFIKQKKTPVRWYMDMDAENNILTLGMSEYEVTRGLFFKRKAGASYPAVKIEVGVFLFISQTQEEIRNPWRRPLDFLWKNWGRPLFTQGHPLKPDLEPYVRHTYNWAFNSWEKTVWQEFEWQGQKVGAPVFIVNMTQSPNYPGKVNEREFRSIWNQAWFSSLRSASGLFRYARRTSNNMLKKRAQLTKELALAAPRKKGFFDTVIATEMENIEIAGETYNRSKGWQTAYWGNSDRNPVNRPPGGPRIRDVGTAPYHVLDMSWTALLMLRWYEELEQDKRLLIYARTYADSLLLLQDDKGFFPAWLDKKTLHPLGILDQSPETSMSVTFLLKLAQLSGQDRYKSAALKALDAVCQEIAPVGRWEDFETYWSSSSFGSGDLIGKKIIRNNMYKQNNFCIFWTSEALFEAFKVTGDEHFLELGRIVLDELLMTQASWQPPYMYVNVLGGFGVMNCDGEWLDSRESLFAELIIQYGLELNEEEYIQRGLAALRSAFVMMYCPENPRTKALWEIKHPFFGPEDYGFTMENYGHGGVTSKEGAGMGVFTIYDWGNGAAAEAYNRMLDHFGPELVSRIK